MTPDPTERFTDRVANYTRYRPGYPDELVPAIRARAELPALAAIADIGSGTGISSELFLRAGHSVIGVEPNDAMRGAAERLLARFPQFRSVKGTAADTTLPDGSVDLVTAAQAFHWFDPAPSRQEFTRILKPGGSVALFWNSRRTRGTPFLEEYEELLREFGTDYATVDHQNITSERLGSFFGGPYHTDVFRNEQVLDYEGLEGRLLSASYAPAPGHPRHEPMIAALRAIFDAHQEAGFVRILYDTELYVGLLPTLGA